MTSVTVKAERRPIPPPPPKDEIVITMSPEEAVMLRNDLRAVANVSTVQHFGINRVLNALDNLDLT